MNRKLVFPTLMLVLAVLARSLPGTTATSTPTAVVVTPVVITTTPTPSLPVLSTPITSFHMLDANNGWAVGDANVMRTTDGGTTWYDVTPPGVTSLGFSADSFYLDANTAWVASRARIPPQGRSTARRTAADLDNRRGAVRRRVDRNCVTPPTAGT